METTVRTIIIATGAIHDERSVLMNTEKGRTWLMKHLWYCLCNGMGVQIFNAKDGEPEGVAA